MISSGLLLAPWTGAKEEKMKGRGYLLITIMAFRPLHHSNSAKPDSLILFGYKGKHLRGSKTDI